MFHCVILLLALSLLLMCCFVVVFRFLSPLLSLISSFLLLSGLWTSSPPHIVLISSLSIYHFYGYLYDQQNHYHFIIMSSITFTLINIQISQAIPLVQINQPHLQRKKEKDKNRYLSFLFSYLPQDVPLLLPHPNPTSPPPFWPSPTPATSPPLTPAPHPHSRNTLIPRPWKERERLTEALSVADHRPMSCSRPWTLLTFVGVSA